MAHGRSAVCKEGGQAIVYYCMYAHAVRNTQYYHRVCKCHMARIFFAYLPRYLILAGGGVQRRSTARSLRVN